MKNEANSDELFAIKADTFRQCGDYSWKNFIICILTKRTFRPLVTLRICQRIARSHKIVRIILPFFMILHRLFTSLAGMDLSWRTRIDAGLAITHGWGLVVSPGTIIGRNVTLFHGVTLGRRDKISSAGERSIGYPILEDEVWVGPHAIIVGGITMGRGSRIGGGAFVTESVPPYSVVTGNPGNITKQNCIPDVYNPVKF